MKFNVEEARILFSMFDKDFSGDIEEHVTIIEEGGNKKAFYEEYPEHGHIILDGFCECSLPIAYGSSMYHILCKHCHKRIE